MTVKMIPEQQWYYDAPYHVWTYRIGPSFVTVEPRPAYCDRGHWIGKVFGVEDIDSHDSFPRYYMDWTRATDEMREWLHWRLKV